MKERTRDDTKELIKQYAGQTGQANSSVMNSHTYSTNAI